MSQTPMYSVVSSDEAKRAPYPYVYVNEDGTVRELHDDERRYLEEPFPPFDGGRPYVKMDFLSRDGWGSIQGFCHRSHVPRGTRIASAPAQNPNHPMTKAQRIEWLKKKMVGFEVIENPDGTVIMKRVANPPANPVPASDTAHPAPIAPAPTQSATMQMIPMGFEVYAITSLALILFCSVNIHPVAKIVLASLYAAFYLLFWWNEDPKAPWPKRILALIPMLLVLALTLLLHLTIGTLFPRR